MIDVTRMTKDEAKDQIRKWSETAEYENYHSLSAMLEEDVLPLIDSLSVPTLVVVPLEYNGTTEAILVS